jgi:uncharacterized UBP type Zn finger protein
MATWTISTLERNTADGGVTVAHWIVSEEETVGENTYSASSYGTVGFTPDASAEGYIAYGVLVEDTVLNWVWEQVDKDAIEASLTANIELQKNPVTADGVPW